MKENLPIFLRKKREETYEFVSKDDDEDDDALDFILYTREEEKGRIKDGFFLVWRRGGGS